MPFSSDKTSPAVGSRKQIKLLVVDDQREHFEALQHIADMYNPEYSVELRLATDSKEALQVTNEWKPSVVLLDLHIAAEALQLVQQLSAIGPSVVTTSEIRMPEMLQKSAQYGAMGYQAKSENMDDVEALLSFIASIASPPPSAH